MSTLIDPQSRQPHAGDPQPGYDARPTSVAAVVGLVGAFLFWPVGLVASIVGLAHTKPGRKKGRGIAIAGLVVSILAAIVAIVVVVAIAGAASSPSVQQAVTEASEQTESADPAPAAKGEAPTAEEAPAEEGTASQRQALRAAQQYLDTQAFSYAGLVTQLSSEYGSQFSVEDATWAVDRVGADWNAEAARAAEQYLETQAFSREGLVDQLSSEYGSKFTVEQAEHGATQVGL